MKLELTQKLQQQQVLAPQMILSMDVLLLTVQELQTRIEKELQENPALELSEPGPADAPEGASATGSAEGLRKDAQALFDRLASFETYSRGEGRRTRREASDDKHEMLQNTEGRPPGLKEHLTQQLHLIGLDQDIQAIGEEIIQNLDHRGYLPCPAAEVFQSLGDRCSDASFKRALKAVRGLDPPGVGAEDLRQCLLLQLERDGQEYPVESQIILHHLEDLGQNKIPKIAKEIGATLEDVKDAVEIITSLDPLPGSRYEDEPTIYVRPEVFVEKKEGRFEVRVDDESLPQLHVSETCRRILKESRGNPQVTTFLRKKIESAQWLLHAIHQRRRTLYDIAVAMVGYQSDFMENGPEHLRAMRMQSIADVVHVHISTVCRAIKGKYMQTPWGVFEMRYFFTGGVSKADGELESRRNVCRAIEEIIAGEDKRHPLSDSDIAKVLTGRGLDIARRTVTKYRESRKVPSSRVRKAY